MDVKKDIEKLKHRIIRERGLDANNTGSNNNRDVHNMSSKGLLGVSGADGCDGDPNTDLHRRLHRNKMVS